MKVTAKRTGVELTVREARMLSKLLGDFSTLYWNKSYVKKLGSQKKALDKVLVKLDSHIETTLVPMTQEEHEQLTSQQPKGRCIKSF